MNLALLICFYAVVAYCSYKIGYINGRRREIETAKQFVDAILSSIEETMTPKKKRGRPVGSKNKRKS